MSRALVAWPHGGARCMYCTGGSERICHKCSTLCGSFKSNWSIEPEACLETTWSTPKESKPSHPSEEVSLALPANNSTQTTPLRGRPDKNCLAASSKLDRSAAADAAHTADGRSSQACCCKERGFRQPGSAHRRRPRAHVPSFGSLMELSHQFLENCKVGLLDGSWTPQAS